MLKIDWSLWNTVTANLGFTLCNGEEKTLTEAEVANMNTLLREMAVRSQGVRHLATEAQKRFASQR